MPTDARERALPFGSWPTPITSAVVVTQAVGLSDGRLDGDGVIWSESRPGEGGRTALVRRDADGATTELLAPGENARTAVHEYGGGSWWSRDGTVWFTSWEDQRIYRRDPVSGQALALTPVPARARGDRYADGDVSPDGEWIACVRERHPPDSRGPIDVSNEIVRVDARRPADPETVVSGPDFVSNPRFSRDGARLCWLEWDHPNMPWDGNRLRIRDLDGGADTLVAGGAEESLCEPCWQDDGSLTFVSDRTGWWNLYRWPGDGDEIEPLVLIDGDIGVPQWVFGISRYAVLAGGVIVFARWRGGFDGLGLRLPDGSVIDLELPYSTIASVRPGGDSSVLVVGATPMEESSLARLALEDGEVRSIETIRPGRDLPRLGVGSAYVSVPEAIEFPSARGRNSHAILYRPTNPDFRGSAGQLPPLLVEIHGGPTSAAEPALQLEIQYWTSRGFAFLDLNYGGSTGYGRAYRDLLRGEWGVVDVEDCIAAARWMADRELVDPKRMCLRGGSAGGFTTLATLARADTPFAAGADYFGVAELESFATATHKFESHYLETLVGPYPAQAERYRERSPIEHMDAFTRPLIVLQGLEDEVVPPDQATMTVEALRGRGVPVAYLAFEGEQHGFRRNPNIRLSLDSELSFYAQIFDIELPSEEGIEPVKIEWGSAVAGR
jgi:dipeptidyl aminopeptidase/acylaminoacyl peptidase